MTPEEKAREEIDANTATRRSSLWFRHEAPWKLCTNCGMLRPVKCGFWQNDFVI